MTPSVAGIAAGNGSSGACASTASTGSDDTAIRERMCLMALESEEIVATGIVTLNASGERGMGGSRERRGGSRPISACLFVRAPANDMAGARSWRWWLATRWGSSARVFLRLVSLRGVLVTGRPPGVEADRIEVGRPLRLLHTCERCAVFHVK